MLLALLLACHPQTSKDPWRPTTTTTTWSAEGADPIPVPDALASMSWLGQPSTWRWAGTPADGRERSGSFGLGNGRVFGIVGLDSPHDTITNLVGPGYQVHDGFFPDVRLAVYRDGVEVVPEEERVEMPRGVPVVRYWARAGSLTWTFSDALGTDTWVRHFAVWAGGPEDGLTLAWVNATGEPWPVTRGEHTLDAECERTEVPALDKGGDWSITCQLRFDGAEPDFADRALESAQLEGAALLDQAVALETPDEKVGDLYRGALLTLLAQTADTGVVSPMSRYTKAYLRDSEGAVRLLLAAGLHERAEDVLDGLYGYAAGSASIANSYDLDGPTGFDAPDWGAVPFMPGREAAEAPSYLPILNAEFRAHAGYDAISDEAFLRACVERQAFTDGLLPFSGDETFRYTMAPVVGDMPEALGWSANSSVLWVRAAEALGLDAGEARARLGEVFADGTGALAPIAAYDSLTPVGEPFPDVALQPWWLFGADDPLAGDAALDGVLAAVWNDDGTAWNAGAPFTTGMVPGYLLRAVADREEAADAAFNALDAMATPSGHFEEVHTTADLLPLAASHSPDGLGADVSARFRPWETGVVAAALLDFLVGARPDAATGALTLAPHLPNDWPEMTVRRLRMGDERYDVEVKGYVEGVEVTVTRDGGSAEWQVTVGAETLPLPPGGSETWILPAP